MRVTAFRAWLSATVNQGIGSARKAAKAVTKRLRAATGQVDAGVGAGDDESSFGGQRSRVWFEFLEETRKKLLEIFDKTVFERFPRVQKMLRRFLGSREIKTAPSLPPPPKVTGPLGAQNLKGSNDPDMQAQIARGRFEAHTREQAGLRQRLERERTPTPSPTKTKTKTETDSEN